MKNIIKLVTLTLIVSSFAIFSEQYSAYAEQPNKNSRAFKLYKEQLENKLNKDANKAGATKQGGRSGDGTISDDEAIELLDSLWRNATITLNVQTTYSTCMKKGRRVQTTGKVYKNTFLDAVVVAYGYGYSSSNEENSSSLKKIRKDIDKGEYFVLSQRKNTSSSMINYYMSPNSSVEFYDEIKEYIVAGAFIIESYRQEHFPSSEAEWEGNGSGFFIDKRGYIATNHHVIQGASEIQVSFGRNQNEIQTYKADVVHSNKGIDVAIIKIDDARFKPFGYIPYNISSGVSPVGTAAYAMGYPLHMQLSEEIRYTEGYINALSGFRNDPNAYQMQVPIQPGNSGGPLFDKKGNLIGINSSGIDAYQNVNFAVKSTVLIDFISSSIKPKLVLPNDTKTLSKAKDMSEMVEIVKPYVVLIKVR